MALKNFAGWRFSIPQSSIRIFIDLRVCERSGGDFQLNKQSRSEMYSRAGKLCNKSLRGTASSSFQRVAESSMVFRIVELKRNPRRKDVRVDWNLAPSDILSARERSYAEGLDQTCFEPGIPGLE